MKKLLALVLAVMMLGTVAFAAVEVGAPGTRGDDVVFVEPNATIQIFAGAFLHEDIAETGLIAGAAATDVINSEVAFTSDNFRIAEKKWDKGAALVKSIGWNDDDECIEIKLVEDKELYTKVLSTAAADLVQGAQALPIDFKDTGGTIANLVIKSLVVESTRDIKADEKIADLVLGKDASSNEVTVTVAAKGDLLEKKEEYVYVGATDFRVGYAYMEVKVAKTKKDPVELTMEPKMFPNVNILTPADAAVTESDAKDPEKEGVAYMTYKFKGDTSSDLELTYLDDEGDEIAYLETRVYENDEVNFSYDTEISLDLVKKYRDADLRAFNLGGELAGNIEVYADEEEFLYEIVDDEIVKSSLKWDDDAYAYVGKVSELGKYVISDIELDVAGAAVENPDTGANDVVGIAVALAAVAAVSAAAVSLKK